MITLVTYTCASPLNDFSDHQNTLREPAIKLARDAVHAFLVEGKRAPAPRKLPILFTHKAAVFVTIAKNGRRRGCKGVFEPATTCLKDEIIRAAIGAATGDIRYRPIRSNELDELTFSVSIVGPLKHVQDPAAYSCFHYGLLLRGATASGVILPGEAKTNSWRLAEAKRQAHIRRGEHYEIFVFETLALHEERK